MRPAVPVAVGTAGFVRWHDEARRLAEWVVVALPALFVLGRAVGDVAVCFLGIVFLVDSALRRDWSWAARAWVRIALALWAYLVVANLFTADPSLGLGHAVVYARFIIFAVALEHWLLADPVRRRRFTWVLAWVVAFVAADCIVQFVGGVSVTGQEMPESYRLSGPFSGQKPGTYLAKSGFIVIAALAVWAARPGRWGKLALVVALGALGFVILLTGERSALVGFAVAAATMLALVREFRPLLAVGAVVAGLGATVIVLKHPTLMERLIEHTRQDVIDFEDQRYGQIARTALALWERSPIVGIGLKHYRVMCSDPALEAIGPLEARCYPHPHHVYLEWLTETGLIGLVGFLVLIGAWAGRIGRAARAEPVETRALAACAAAALVVFLWPFATSMSLFVTWNGILLWTAVGWAMAVTRV